MGLQDVSPYALNTLHFLPTVNPKSLIDFRLCGWPGAIRLSRDRAMRGI